MSDYYDKTRLLVARLEGEKYPYIVGAMSQSTWEIVPVEDWDRWKREMLEKAFGPDWQSYDAIEVVMTFPADELSAMFDAQEIKPASLEVATDV